MNKIPATYAGKLIKGIDVSGWQPVVDFKVVKEKGIDFAIMKSTEGLSYVSPAFKKQWEDAAAFDLIRGAYHWLSSNSDGEKQADFMLSKVLLEVGDLPLVADFESDGHNKNRREEYLAVPDLAKFLHKCDLETGLVSILYTGPYFFRDTIARYLRSGGKEEVVEMITSRPLWIANYGSPAATDPFAPPNLNPLVPANWKKWTFHQYTDSLYLSSILSRIDGNVFDGSLDDLKKLTLGYEEKPSGPEPLKGVPDSLNPVYEDKDFGGICH